MAVLRIFLQKYFVPFLGDLDLGLLIGRNEENTEKSYLAFILHIVSSMIFAKDKCKSFKSQSHVCFKSGDFQQRGRSSWI